MTRNDDRVFIKSLSSCPFSASTAEHPEICHLAEVLLSEITGLEVVEHCERGPQPRCSFEVLANEYARAGENSGPKMDEQH